MSWPWELPAARLAANATSTGGFEPWSFFPATSPPPPPSVAAFPNAFHFDKDFLIGVATAPAHVEDELDDAWVPFCKEPGNCHAWLTTPRAAERLRFWTEPEVEIGLATELGSSIFRMGVDWSRLAPHPPSAFANASTPLCDSYCAAKEAGAVSALATAASADRDTKPPPLAPSHPISPPPEGCVCSGVHDSKALRRYGQIVRMAKAKGMKVALTIFHHSLPVWVGEAGGWLHARLVREFGILTRDIAAGLGEDVDFWLTMNEPMAFALFTYIEGTWPQALPKSSYVDVLLQAVENTDASIRSAVQNLADAHRLAYAQIHQVHTQLGWRRPQVGMAARAQILEPATLTDIPAVALSREFMDFTITDKIKDRLDFLGLNYYGKEIISGATIAQPADIGFSEAGRAIDTEGLYSVLRMFHERYASDAEATFSSYMVTENGVADSTDVLRPAFITEHLAAIAAAVAAGIPVSGYIHWTISDNWEWADGYCPKFGMYAVDRTSPQLTRTARPSAKLFATIARSGAVSKRQREEAWALVLKHRGEPRPFCRSTDGKEGLDMPRTRPFSSSADWRFREEKIASSHLNTGGLFLQRELPAAHLAAPAAPAPYGTLGLGGARRAACLSRGGESAARHLLPPHAVLGHPAQPHRSGAQIDEVSRGGCACTRRQSSPSCREALCCADAAPCAADIQYV